MTGDELGFGTGRELGLSPGNPALSTYGTVIFIFHSGFLVGTVGDR